MQKAFLFVGGPIDGQTRHVELNDRGEPRPIFQVDVWNGAKPLCYFDSDVSLIAIYTYRLIVLADSDGNRIVFYAGHDVPAVLARLMSGYKPS